MHIGMIFRENRKFPPDIRIEKEVKALSDAGHHITILARRTSPDIPSKIDLIPGRVCLKRASVGEMGLTSKMIRIFSLHESTWVPHITNFIETEQPDVLHVHDFPMVPTVVRVAKKYDLPVVADLHENMPAALVAYRSSYPLIQKSIHRILYNYRLWRWHEARYLRHCKKIIIVVPEAGERLKSYGLNDNKIVVVSNTEDETTFKFDPRYADNEIIEMYKKKWMICYVGGMRSHRGLDTVLHAIPHACGHIPDLKLTIVGADNEDKKNMEQKVGELSIEEYVDIIKWQPYGKIHSYILASQVCLVPHNDFEHTHTTVPHKLFQYMICSRPVLVSSCKPLKRIVQETKAGKVFKTNDSRNLATQLTYMYNHPDEIVQCGRNAYEAAIGKYAWHNDAKRLIEIYNGLT